MRRIAILDAPSNLGLRPPTVTSVPGCAKAPGALRDHGLITRLHARDAGCLTPPRYDPGEWRPGDGVCHASEIAAYSRKLADRIGGIIDAGEFPVVLGGDCSILIGTGLAMHRLGEAVGGRIGLVFVDGHSDFRHPGNASYVGAAAGEDLALVTGRGQTDLAAIEGRRPYFRDVDVVVMGIRAQDEYRLDLQAAGIITRPVPTLRVEGAARSAQWARDQLVDCAGYWVHVDMDVLDPAVMPAVDAPEPGGIAFPELELLLAGLVDTPHCLGVEITVFDPDYDADGAYAEEITSALVSGLAPVRTVAARPDLIAARRDLAARNDAAPGDVLGAERFGPGRLGPGRLGPGRLGPGRLGPGRLGSGSDDEVEEGRAGAAAQSVTLAAAGMSDGGAALEEAAVPATTLLGVEEAGQVDSPVANAHLTDKSEMSDEDNSADEFDEIDASDVEAGDVETGGVESGDVEESAASDGELADSAADDADSDAADGDGSGGSEGNAAADHWSDKEPDAGQDLNSDHEADSDPDDSATVLDSDPDDSATVLDSDPDDSATDSDPDPDDSATDSDPDPDGSDTIRGSDTDQDDSVNQDGDSNNQDGDDEDSGDQGDGSKLEDRETEPAQDEWRPAVIPTQPASRPLGSAPLLDSQPLPATRPGMLRPRTVEGFSLPAQRPAFDVGPADIA